MSFETHYDILGEIGLNAGCKIYEIRKRSTGKFFAAKIICKLGLDSKELERFQQEISFWKRNIHPNIIELVSVFDEPSFIYVIYEYAQGGDLASISMNNSMVFSEGFARHIAEKILSALIFLHSNGISHGGCLPLNIVFLSTCSTPGWVHSAKLGFFHIDSFRNATIFTDIQDAAYSLCFILRRNSGLIFRSEFHPRQLYYKGWEHLSEEFLDFIKQMWFCEEQSKSIHFLTHHPWMTSGDQKLTKEGLDIQSLLSSSMISKQSNNNNILSKKGWLLYKNSQRDSLGRRRWVRVWAHLLVNVLIFSENDPLNPIDNNTSKSKSKIIIPSPIYLYGKAIIISALVKHDYVFAIQDASTQIIVAWLRFYSSSEYHTWHLALMDITDPAKQQTGQIVVDDIVEGEY